MKVILVSPRIESATVGGAERLILRLAEELQKAKISVEIFTTCAGSHESWQNTLPEGTTNINQVSVTRFPVSRRNSALYRSLDQKIRQGIAAESEILQWSENSVHSDKLYETIKSRKDETDAFIFAPYLWGLAIKGSQLVPDKSVLIPCFHDEPYAYTSPVKKMVRNIRAALFNTPEEKMLAEKIFDKLPEHSEVLGMPIDLPTADPQRFRKIYQIEDPFILYAGRMEGGKNIHLLAEYFLHYKTKRNNNLRLCLMGKGADTPVPPGKHGSIINLGFIPEEYKFDAYSAALCFCQPSVNESFSIVLLESILCKTPGLVYSKSPVLAGHIKRSGGGLVFQDYYDFENTLDLFLENPQASKEMGELGATYVSSNYKEDIVRQKLIEFLKGL